MKKLGLFIVSVFALSLTFTGCNEETADAAKTVEAVTVSSVIPAGTVQKKTINTPEEFNQIVGDAILDDFQTYFGALIEDEEGDDGLEVAPPSNPLTNMLARAVEAVTFDQLMNEIMAVPDNLDASITTNDDTHAMTINCDWKGPTGKIDMGDSPVELTITSLNFSIKGGAIPVQASEGEEEPSSMRATGSASASAAASVSLTPVEGAEAIKSLKLNAIAGASVTNAAIEATPGLMDDGGLEAALGSVSANVYLYAGASGALCFEVTKDGEVYNGVISASASVSADTSINKDTVTNFESFMDTMDSETAEEIPVSVNLVLKVYDTEGNFLFDYINVSKPADLAALFNED